MTRYIVDPSIFMGGLCVFHPKSGNQKIIETSAIDWILGGGGALEVVGFLCSYEVYFMVDRAVHYREKMSFLLRLWA